MSFVSKCFDAGGVYFMCVWSFLHAWNEIFRWQAATLVLVISFSLQFFHSSLQGHYMQLCCKEFKYFSLCSFFFFPAVVSLKWDAYKLNKGHICICNCYYRDRLKMEEREETQSLVPTGLRALSALYISFFLVFFFFLPASSHCRRYQRHQLFFFF